MSSTAASTAGRGDPYWYEWFVGVNEVLNLLDSDSDTHSVAFQVEGVKGWDDVVVRLRSGGRRCYQVKHTRAEDTLTFGDLVGSQENETSLLSWLFASWKASGLNDGSTLCVLYTNREAGNRYSTAGNVQRPPLVAFMNWLGGSLPDALAMTDLVPEERWKDAWIEWCAQLNGSESEQLAFLRSLVLRTKQDDLDGLLERITQALSSAFGVSAARVAPLVDGLHRALRKWTTGHTAVTAEELYSELALEAEQRELAPAPPPPAPFFPTRVPFADALETALAGSTAESVIFLTAEPGAGKTSVLSWLANRRNALPFTGNVGLRFFCFEPIRPEAPFIAPDASRVQPSDLWFSLLSQLREGLRGRLRALNVPLRNDLLTWHEARTHVLRLASTLGFELARPFVIVIDGIDHAARAAQTMPQQSVEFFASLPSPDELKGKAIRLLIAGQPAASHSAQYPNWLVSFHPCVRRIELPGLEIDDVRALVQEAKVSIMGDQLEAVVRLIQQVAKGNTLATVFAVAEAEKVGSVIELDSRLTEMRLNDGLETYYASIWQHALRGLVDLTEGVDACLTASLSLGRRGVTPEFLAVAFSEWQRPTGWWAIRLEDIGPLLTAGTDGYRVRHNDVRVFLAGRFAGLPSTRQKRVASQLADYFRREDCDRVLAHLQLLELLTMAGRSSDFSLVFNVDWVYEAGELGIDTARLVAECEASVHGLTQLREWPVVVSVACAAQTLERLVEAREYGDYATPHQAELPPFLPSEATVLALSQWSLGHLSSLVRDAERLVEADEQPRALALLQRWLEGLDLGQMVELLGDRLDDQFQLRRGKSRISDEAASVFEALGRLCGQLRWVFPMSRPSSRRHTNSLLAFEFGYVAAILRSEELTLSELFVNYRPRYVRSWEFALRGLAASQSWAMVREVLDVLKAKRRRLSADSLAEITEWALRSGAYKHEPGWLTPIRKPAFGMDARTNYASEPTGRIRPYLAIAYSLGWTRVAMDGRDIAETIYKQFDPNAVHESWRAPALAVFLASALLGRADSAYSRGGDEEVSRLLTPTQFGEILSSLWGPVVRNNIHFLHRDCAAELAESIVNVCGRLGGNYDANALQQAIVYAAEFPVDLRQPAIWYVLRRHGKRDLMRHWVLNWIGEEGNAWRLSHDEMHSVVRRMLPLAEEVGEGLLATHAAARLSRLLIGYRSHKEYGFADILDWYDVASRLDPALWRTVGWKIWHLCDLCRERDGDNRHQGALRTSVSAAAIGCGPGNWLALIESTITAGLGGKWYASTGQQFIEGIVQAIDYGRTPSWDDLPVIWSLGLAFCLWNDEDDNSALRQFREALLSVPGTVPEARPLLDALAKTSRSSSLDLTPIENKESSGQPIVDDPAATATPHITISSDIVDGKSILPSVAASIVCALATASSADRDTNIDTVLMAIGTDGYTDWSYSDRNVFSSLEQIARIVNDDQLWLIVGAIAKGMDHNRQYSIYGAYPNLFRLALARSKLRGVPELIAGIDTQIDMHARWAGCERPENYVWLPSPALQSGVTWQAVVVRLVGLLLTSESLEVLTATLEATHALAAARPTSIADLFDVCKTEWQRYWLLSAAESWSALHSDDILAVRPILERFLVNGSLIERLQSWLVLDKLTETSGGDQPSLLLSATTSDSCVSNLHVPGGLLHSQGARQGHFRFSDNYSSARRILHALDSCGLNFGSLEPRIAELLSETPSRTSRAEQQAPRGHSNTMCYDLRTETAIGTAILEALSGSDFDRAVVPFLAQGYLSSDDAWLQRSPPRRASASASWISSQPYTANEPESEDARTALLQLALSLDVAPGWRTFISRVFDCTLKHDYVLYLWYEQSLNDGLLTPNNRPTCPSGRTFLWWMDDFFEPSTMGARFVSGFFVGGGQRLGHAFLQTQPSCAWRGLLGWEIDQFDPLTWRHGHAKIARYERLHGPLERVGAGPRLRQPIIDRWVITDTAFDQVQRIVGPVRLRQEFSSIPFQ